MRQLEFNESGEAIDKATGEIIGRRDGSGRLVLDNEKMMELKTLKAEPSDGSGEEARESPEEKEEPKRSGPTLSGPIKPEKTYTKYEVGPDSEFTVRFCLGFDDGLITVYREDSYQRLDGLERHWARFRMWTYREELEWKNQSLEFDQQSRGFRQNTDRLNEIKIRKLLRDWSFAEIDPKFKLLHVGGVLSDESYEVFMGMSPSILDNLIILMNNVLE